VAGSPMIKNVGGKGLAVIVFEALEDRIDVFRQIMIR
jgi:hypothetical protein